MIFLKAHRNFFKSQAQVSLEFAFCMIIVLLMMYALFMVFRWTGIDLAGRRRSHDRTITAGNISYGNIGFAEPGQGPDKQLDPYFHRPTELNAVFDGGQ